MGVDVFFVISGFLITTIILTERERGTYSLIDFYERRARRILPALFLVMLVSVGGAWIWLLPPDMKDFSQSLIAVSTFSSNILFWQEEGYWGAANELKPLLHTWSLAVEEQYYILFPLFLGVMWRFRKRWILGAFVLVAVASLGLAEWASVNQPTANFFLLPTRGWELAIGAGIAFVFFYRQQAVRTLLSNKAATEVMGLVGLLMIVYANIAFDETTPFPSVYALVPTIGTGLVIIFASSETVVGRLLGTRVLVGIGLISYSAYLWHQPMFAYARHATPTEPSTALLLGLSALTFPLAYLTWKFVEAPFRKRGGMSRGNIFRFALTGSAAFIAIGLAGQVTSGFADRTSESGATFETIEPKLAANYGLSNACSDAFNVPPECRTHQEPEILLWGDSFAMHIAEGIVASNPDVRLVQMTKSTCGPFFDVAPISERYPVVWGQGCLEFVGQVRDWLEANDSVEYVVMSSPFDQYLSPDGKLLFRDGRLLDASLNLAAAEFERTLAELESMGVTPVIFSPPPANGIDLGRCLARSEWSGRDLSTCDFEPDEMIQPRLDAFALLDRVNEDFRVIRLDDLICDTSVCQSHLDSTYIFRDGGHLSIEGSSRLGSQHDFYQMVVENSKIAG